MGAWLLVWLLAWAVLPVVLKAQLEKIAEQTLGRQLTVGTIDFKPWSLELTLSDIALAPKPAPPGAATPSPQLSIKRLYIDAELVSLLRLAPVVDALVVEEPVLSLTHGGQGRYDIDDILARLQPSGEQTSAGAQRFALYNLELRGGRLDFHDQAMGQLHELRELTLSVPFLSNLASQREVKTAPHLAFRLNGSSFDTAAVGTPFAQTRKTDASIALRGLDLGPYLGYWPASLPWRLQAAVLNADLKLAFEQAPDTVVRVSGSVSADKVRLIGSLSGPPLAAAATGPELLGFERLALTLEDVRPLQKVVRISALTLSAPTLDLARDRAGRVNLLPASAPDASKNIADSAGPPRAAGPKDAQTAASSAWTVQVAQAAVRDGVLNWLDESLPSPARIQLTGLTLDASALALPFAADAPVRFQGSLGLAQDKLPAPGRGHAAAAPALLRFSGSATDQAAQATASSSGWPLDMAAKYVGQFLLPALKGQLDAELAVAWQAASGDKPQTLRVTAPQLSLRQLELAEGKTSLLSAQRVDLGGVDIDLMGQSFQAASMQLSQPRARVARAADQSWMYEGWLVPAAQPAPDPAAASQAPAWTVGIADLSLEGGALSFSDKAGAKPVAFELTTLKARLQDLVLDNKATARPMPLSASLRLGDGSLDFQGSLGLAPLQAQGRLQLDRLPVQVLEPYFGDTLNIALLGADASFKGDVAWRQTPQGPQASLAGDLALEDFRANTLAPGEDLLAWKALKLRGLRVALVPAQATRVDVKETVLSDFFARVIVMPDGRINLQDLIKTPANAIKKEADGAGSAGVSGQKGLEATASSAPAAAAGPAPVIHMGPMTLVNGTVLFADRFVKPNYSANLSALTGKLGAFSSVATDGAPAMAELELRGLAEGTASLEILGKLNPLAQPLALDIQGKVRDLELPPLSPYAVKYAGYGIRQGRLSVDVNYRVQSDGQLTASNKLTLHQLSFGERVEGATASLPVKLAVALLADRHGVIDLDLPISGSLNDPQFSLGPVIARAIVNLVVKAITSPFSLLAGALGGEAAQDLASVAFAPGSALLSAQARAGLDKVAQALVDRPALQLTVVGSSSLSVEREGFKRAQLAQRLQAEKQRAGPPQAAVDAEPVEISPAEMPQLLRQVYQRAEMTKPRNFIGLARDLPADEMEKLLLADISVGEDAMRALAVQRGEVVRDYLAGKALAPDRLRLGSPQTVAPTASWTPRAELNLAMP